MEKSNEIREIKRQMLTLLTEDFLTFKQVIKQLNLKRRTAYRYLEGMKNAGVITGNSWMGFAKKSCAKNDYPLSEGGGTTDQLKNIYSRTTIKPLWRYHGIEFYIKLSYETKYRRRVFDYRGSRIIFKKKTITIHSKKNQFEGHSVKEIEKNMLDFFWNYYFPLVESRYNIPFLKEGKANIEIVNGHVEEYDSETGMWLKKNKMKRFQCRSKDGKVWMEYDESFNGTNIEFKHPQTHTEDAEMIVEDILNSWKEGRAMTPIQTQKAIGDLTMNFHYYAENMKSHVDAVKKLGKAVENLTKKIKGL